MKTIHIVDGLKGVETSIAYAACMHAHEIFSLKPTVKLAIKYVKAGQINAKIEKKSGRANEILIIHQNAKQS